MLVANHVDLPCIARNISTSQWMHYSDPITPSDRSITDDICNLVRNKSRFV